MNKVKELIANGDFPNASYVVHYAVMYAIGGGELCFLNECRAERMNAKLIQYL
jgi:hypothetical protein